MMKPEQSTRKTYFNWSSGKDAALALYLMQQDSQFKISKLLTTVNSHFDRVTMHGLRRSLLEAQTRAIDIPLNVIELPEQPSMEDYAGIMTGCVQNLRSEGYTDCGFGDIFLEDLRAYREEQLKPFNIHCHFPLWQRNTTDIISEFIDLGFKAVVICADANLLDESFVGREIDESFTSDLPDNVDSCGENGEFHTFCYDGPIFKHPVSFSIGQNTYREYDSPDKSKEKMGFWFCDLIPNS